MLWYIYTSKGTSSPPSLDFLDYKIMHSAIPWHPMKLGTKRKDGASGWITMQILYTETCFNVGLTRDFPRKSVLRNPRK